MTDEQHDRFMRMAIDKAMDGIANGQTPFGACIVRNGEVVSVAHNIVWQTTDISAHAEINAIRQACQRLNTVDLTGSVIYSTCEPCPMCFSACHWARISRIYYGATIEDARLAGFNELSIANIKMKKLAASGVEVVGGVLREQCAELFKTWKARSDNRTY